MKNPYHALLMLIDGATQKELAAQIQYLKAELEIARSKLPQRVTVTAQERNRLAKFGAKLGRALDKLVTIVHPDTLRRWIRESKKRGKKEPVKRGRRRTAEDIRRLIIKLAKENEWGDTRILGELRKLNITSASRNTVKKILKEHGLDPGPARGRGTWDNFLEMVEFYHESRPHQAKENHLLVQSGDAKEAEEGDVVRLSDLRCRRRLGRVLKHYYLKVA